MPFRECACPVFVEFVETCSLKWLDSAISTRHGKSDNGQGPKEKDGLQYLTHF